MNGCKRLILEGKIKEESKKYCGKTLKNFLFFCNKDRRRSKAEKNCSFHE